MWLRRGPEGKLLKDKGGEGRDRRGQDPPEDEVPVLKPKADEVLASARLSRLLPGKHSISAAPAAVTASFLSPTSLATERLGSLRSLGQTPHTHLALPDQEAAGRAGPNLQLDGLRHLGEAAVGKQGEGQKSHPGAHRPSQHWSHLLEKTRPGRARKPLS